MLETTVRIPPVAQIFSLFPAGGPRLAVGLGRAQALLDLVAEVGRRASGPRVESEWNGLDEKKNEEILPLYY